MQRPITVLVTNDDGPESPLLPPFLEALAAKPWVAELRVAVPSRNRSWISGAVSRSNPVTAERATVAGRECYLVDGYPADCASLGIFNLFSSPPDLLLSGPNLGQNSGVPFSCSSGTLGAASMGSLSGVNSIACSTHLTKEAWDALGTGAVEPFRTDWQRISAVTVELCERLLAAKLFEFSPLLNLNTPWSVTSESPLRLAHLHPGKYGQLFREESDGTFKHRDFKLLFDPADEDVYTDVQCLSEGNVSLSLLNPALSSRVLSPERELEIVRRFASLGV